MHDDEVRLRNCVRIVDGRLVVVRIDIRLEDAGHRDAVAADILHEVLNLRRRRRDRHLFAGRDRRKRCRPAARRCAAAGTPPTTGR